MSTTVFTVIGATGKVGSELLHFFSQAKIDVQGVTRDITRAREQPYVHWIEGNLSDKERMKDILKESKGVFLATSFSNDFAEKEWNAIAAAREAGVQHMVKLSTRSASGRSEFLIPRLHAQVEDELKGSGLCWTILQPMAFMQNWLGNLSVSVKAERKIYEASGDGRLPYIDTRDIAEVAFTALTGGAAHWSQTYTITGGEAINYYELADIIRQVIGEEVIYIAQTAEEARERLTRKGVPAWGIDLFLTMAENQRLGRTAVMTPTVQNVLGKPPRTVGDFVRDYASWFK